ncbi:hypothetical protein [Halobacterium noricense]|uniref:hypothetical protein n=1 Tax=Halobacterium noricense TaxID=223182 RepID=UPI001E54D721|nr:hypothetical protein [Halobacterium noricense]UHH24275.1 hypothetical protein LT974_09760 [Halobacterium noricense]
MTESIPDGVLRLQYEANPVAYILESAGGAASTGSIPILGAMPNGVHQRVPAFFGTADLLAELEAALA